MRRPCLPVQVGTAARPDGHSGPQSPSRRVPQTPRVRNPRLSSKLGKRCLILGQQQEALTAVEGRSQLSTVGHNLLLRTRGIETPHLPTPVHVPECANADTFRKCADRVEPCRPREVVPAPSFSFASHAVSWLNLSFPQKTQSLPLQKVCTNMCSAGLFPYRRLSGKGWLCRCKRLLTSPLHVN